jgi:hypothetical protein
MRPARRFIRVHAALFCLSVLFCAVVLMGAGAIGREDLLPATLLALAFAEASVAAARYVGPVLQRRMDAQ